jgi:hypothetical protein
MPRNVTRSGARGDSARPSCRARTWGRSPPQPYPDRVPAPGQVSQLEPDRTSSRSRKNKEGVGLTAES